MLTWQSFGASVIGPGHVARGQVNQDAWRPFHFFRGDGIVVADGLGSKQHSDFGSAAACRAVIQAVRSINGEDKDPRPQLLDLIRDNWLSRVSPLGAHACSSTCLFGYRRDDDVELHVGMLGDGLAAVLRTDGPIAVLSDDKSKGFSNITSALSPDSKTSDWQCLSLPQDECDLVLLCTDGIADDLQDVEGFVREFAAAYRHLGSLAAARRLRKMLANWPTPKHTDDKTIACLFKSETPDEQ